LKKELIPNQMGRCARTVSADVTPDPEIPFADEGDAIVR
jgi:hypothetical protein